eukprot:jgi/Bigna1/85453/estExt_fgenesh1_pg.C_40120
MLTCLKRIRKEMNSISEHSTDNFSAGPKDPKDLTEWQATILGPADSPYEDGVFFLDLKFPREYPFKPPIIKFKTKIYHCNVDDKGRICIDILKKNWSPVLTIPTILLSLSSLLCDPNPDDPLVPDIAKLLKNNPKKHDATAREWTKKYAS